MNRTSLFSTIRIALVAGIAATLPTPWLNLNSLFIILLAASWLGDWVLNRQTPRYPFLTLVAFSSFFFLSLISVLYSSNLPVALSKLETRLAIVAFPITLLASNTDSKTRRVALVSFLASCVLMSLLCVGYTFYTNYANGITYHFYNNWMFSSDNLVERFSLHPNYFSIYCAFCVFIAFSLYKEKTVSGWTCFALVVYLTLFQLLLASRVGLLTFAVLLMATLIYESYVRGKLVAGLTAAILFFGVMFILVMNSQTLKDKFDALFDRNIHVYNERFRVNRRGVQWSSALEVFKSSPLVGVGIGDMQDELQKVYLEKGFTEGFENEYNPHNLFLDSAAALGIAGVLANLAVLGICFALAIGRKDILYLQFLMLFLSISLVEATFSVQKGIVFFFFFATLFYSRDSARAS